MNNWSTPINLEFNSNKKIMEDDGNIIEGFWTVTILLKNNDKKNYKFDYRYSLYDDKLKFSTCERESNRHVNLLDKNNNLVLKNSYLEVLDNNFVADFNFDKIGDKNIFIGPLPQNIDDYKKLKEKGITAILNLNSQKDLERRKINLEDHKKIVNDLNLELVHFPIIDFSKEDLSDKLKNASDLLRDLLNKEKIVYVHCTAGMTISPAVVISYLTLYEKYTINDAKDFCKKYRPVICPNMDIIKNVIEKIKPGLGNNSNYLGQKIENNFNEINKIENKNIENLNLKGLKKKKKKLKSILFKTTIFERIKIRAKKGIKFSKKVKIKEPMKPIIKYKKIKKITEEEKYPTQLQIINMEKQEEEIDTKSNKKENIFDTFEKSKAKNNNIFSDDQKSDSESYNNINNNSDDEDKNEESDSIVYINYKYDQFNEKNSSNKKKNYKKNFKNEENDSNDNENSSQSNSINYNYKSNKNKNSKKNIRKSYDDDKEEESKHSNNNDDDENSSRKSWSDVRRESESISRSISRNNINRSQASDSRNSSRYSGSDSGSSSSDSSSGSSSSGSNSYSESDRFNLMKTSYSSKRQKMYKNNNKKYPKNKYDEYEKVSKINSKKFNNIKTMNKNSSENSSGSDRYYNKNKYSKTKTKNKKITKSVDNSYNYKKIKSYNNGSYNNKRKKKVYNNDDYLLFNTNLLKLYSDKDKNENSDESKSDEEQIIEDDRWDRRY